MKSCPSDYINFDRKRAKKGRIYSGSFRAETDYTNTAFRRILAVMLH
jgi:hypothetical protein